jgi:hypothetical protein
MSLDARHASRCCAILMLAAVLVSAGVIAQQKNPRAEKAAAKSRPRTPVLVQ